MILILVSLIAALIVGFIVNAKSRSSKTNDTVLDDESFKDKFEK